MKKLVNKNIIKAMTIGISALMVANSMNLTAFAAEGDTNLTGGNGDGENSGTNDESTNSALATILGEAGEVSGDVSGVINTEIQGTVDYANTEFKYTDEGECDEVIKDAVEEIVNELDGDHEGDFTYQDSSDQTVNFNHEKTEDANNDKFNVEDTKVDAVEAINDVSIALGSIQDKDTLIQTDVNLANNYVEAANDAADEVNKSVGIGTDVLLTDIVEDASDAVDEAITNIGNAKTVDEAEEARKDGETAITFAEKAVTDATTVFTEEKGKYIKAVGDLNTVLKELYGYDVVDENGDPVVDEEGKPVHVDGLVDQYNALKATADADATAAEEELQRLYEDAAVLKKAAAEAEEKYNSAGYAYIAALETAAAEALTNPEIKGDLFKGYYRPLASAIVEFHIMPELGTIIPNSEGEAVTWHEYSGNNFRGSSKGNVLNYGEVQYIDKAGNPQTYRFNYKTADANGRSSKGIVIFVKTEHDFIGADEIALADLQVLNEEGYIFDNEENPTQLIVKDGDRYVRYNLSEVDCTKETIVENLGSEVQVGDTEIESNKDNPVVTVLEDGNTQTVVTETSTTTKTKVEIDTTKGISTVYTYEDGEVVKTESANLKSTTTEYVTTTTTTYTGKDLGGVVAETNGMISETAARDAYIAAIQALIDGLASKKGEENTTKTITIVVGEGENKQEKVYKYGDTATDFGFSLDTYSEVVGYNLDVTYKSKTDSAKWTFDESYLGAGLAYDVAAEAMRLYYTGKYDLSLVQRKYDLVGDLVESVTKTDKKKYGVTYSTTVHGSITANYVTLGSLEIDKSWLIARGISENDINGIKAILAENGLTYVDRYAWDGDRDQYTVYFTANQNTKNITIDGTEINGATVQTGLDSTFTQALRNKGFDTSNLEITYDATTATEIKGNYKYGYNSIKYTLTTVAVANTSTPGTPETDDFQTEVYRTVLDKGEGTNQELTKEYWNDNWYTGDIVLAEYDLNKEEYKLDGKNPADPDNKSTKIKVEGVNALNDTLRTRIEDATTYGAKYGTLIEKIGETQTKINTVKGQIETLKENISNLYPDLSIRDVEKLFGEEGFEEGFDGVYDLELLKEYARDLTEAQDILDKATDDLAKLKGRLGDITKAFDDKSQALTEITEETAPLAGEIPGGDEGGADEGGADEGGADEGGAAGGAPIIGGGANLFVAPGAGGAPAVVDGDGGAAVVDDGGEPVVIENIGDQEAALAGTLTDDDKKIYDIINDPTALADLIEEPGVHISWWWWLLIIVALGATGWAIYRKYRKNKAAEAEAAKRNQK